MPARSERLQTSPVTMGIVPACIFTAEPGGALGLSRVGKAAGRHHMQRRRQRECRWFAVGIGNS